MKVGIVIQARMASTRLPGKILKELPYGSGVTVLEQVVSRASHCRGIRDVTVATTANPEDDRTAELARSAGARIYRGPADDVLSRYYAVAERSGLDVIVRLTSDCPCVDPALIDELLDLHLSSGADYSSNVLKHPYPTGFDVEAVNFYALRAAYNKATEPYDREHVTPFIRRQPDLFRLSSLEAPEALRRGDIRVTLDTLDDYLLLCEIYRHLYSADRDFGFGEVVHLLEVSPWLKEINRRSLAKARPSGKTAMLRQAVRLLELQELTYPADLLRNYLKPVSPYRLSEVPRHAEKSGLT